MGRCQISVASSLRIRPEKQATIVYCHKVQELELASSDAKPRLQLLKGTPGALLIDGYNIMFQWLEEPGQKRLKPRLGAEFNFIREAFLREVSAYSSKELRVMVAFDAMGNLGTAPIVRWGIHTPSHILPTDI